jgi:hypothetical protein
LRYRESVDALVGDGDGYGYGYVHVHAQGGGAASSLHDNHLTLAEL